MSQKKPSWLRRLFVCSAGWCPCAPYMDANGCGGQCIRCGKLVGYLTRAELRRIADYHLPKPKSPK